jgi:hypothetical protein
MHNVLIKFTVTYTNRQTTVTIRNLKYCYVLSRTDICFNLSVRGYHSNNVNNI